MDAIRRDLLASIVSGLMRSAVPAILAIILYPLLLRAGGLELVGTWAVLQLIVNYLGLCTAGLPSLIMRRLATHQMDQHSIIKMIQVVLGGYVLSGLLFGSCLVLFAEPLWKILNLPPQKNMAIIMSIIALAGVSGNLATAYGSVLIGTHRLHVAQALDTAGSLAQFAVAVLFMLGGHAYMGLPICLLAGKATSLVLTAAAARKTARALFTTRPRFRVFQFLSLFRRAHGFVLIDAAYALLQPTVRGLIAITAGTSELAIFDLGSRLPGVLRNLFVSGLTALFPAIATLSAQGQQPAIAQVMRIATGVIVFLAIAPLAGYLMLAKPILFLWIGDIGAHQVLQTTIVMTIWSIITSYNVPFYFSLQALGYEVIVASSVWLQIVLLIPGCFIFLWIGSSAVHFAWVVLVSGILSQVHLYVFAQARAKLLTLTFAQLPDYLVLSLSLAFVLLAAALQIDATNPVLALPQTIEVSAFFLVFWATSLALFLRRLPRTI